MDHCKKCIFHIPNIIDETGTSGSQVRPRKMIQAFEKIGYEVDVVMGYGNERKAAIKKIKANIKNGISYDFLYSESSTMPTLLTEKNHLPLYPTLDFGFFSFCKKNNIPIGLFYRDMHWKFDVYRQAVRGLKRAVATLAYKYDLRKYSSLLDYLYYPSKGMEKYLPVDKLNCRMQALPPGAIYDEDEIKLQEEKFCNIHQRVGDKIRLFYVGGIVGNYKFKKLMQAVKDLDFVELTICCREAEWGVVKSEYEGFLTGNIIVVHKSGTELEKYYKKADICMAFFERGAYVDIGMPVKIFEYLGHTIPIIATKGTAAGNFIEENGIGWAIDYDARGIKCLLKSLHSNPDGIVEKHKNAIYALQKNTWEARARQVQEELLGSVGTKETYENA